MPVTKKALKRDNSVPAVAYNAAGWVVRLTRLVEVKSALEASLKALRGQK